MRIQGRSLYCSLLLTSLVGIQLGAQIAQLRGGFRPFAHAPARVLFSWDMFAIAIDRCAVRWEPPISIEGKPVSAWRSRTARFEFDTVYNSVADYETAARAACAFKTSARTVARLVCLTRDGGIGEEDLDCP
jgi:hypothetical protein